MRTGLKALEGLRYFIFYIYTAIVIRCCCLFLYGPQHIVSKRASYEIPYWFPFLEKEKKKVCAILLSLHVIIIAARYREEEDDDGACCCCWRPTCSPCGNCWNTARVITPLAPHQVIRQKKKVIKFLLPEKKVGLSTFFFFKKRKTTRKI